MGASCSGGVTLGFIDNSAMWTQHCPIMSPVPHVCPICCGKGTVNAGFYSEFGASTTTIPDQCRSCSGSGVLWTGTVKT